MRRRQHDPLPDFDIAVVLQHLGATDVPTGLGWVKMFCPFHENTNSAAAAVNHELAAFTCHGCGVRGDGLKLLQTQLGLQFTEALALAKELCGVTDSQPRRASTRRASDLLRR